MVYRYGWIAGIAGIGLALWELSFLLRPSTSGTPWPIAILIATLLGAGITWTAIAYRAHAIVVIGANVIAFIMTAGLLVAPETLWIVFPTRATYDSALFELERAFEIIRYGVEPVRPVPGLVMLLGGLFWTLGFLLVAGLLNRRPYVAVLTPLIVALQFVIIDRKPQGLAHFAVFVTVVALSLLAIRIDERDSGTGRLQRVDATTRPSHRPSTAITALMTMTIVASVAVVAIAGERVPDAGLVTWRSPAGYSDAYSGSASYNPFTDIRAGLINQTTNPLFRADIEGADPATVRFRTVTLDEYQNGRWQTDRVQIYPLDEEPWTAPEQAYRGVTDEVTATIQIENLSQPWMPAPQTPVAVAALDRDDQAAMRVRRLDGSLMIPGDLTYEGMVYQVVAEVPRYDGPTIAALAQTNEGTLSPLFATAQEQGRTLPDLTGLPEELELPDEEFWLEYPYDDLGGRAFESYAERIVGNVDTNFEKAIALENWFRDSGEFVYNDEVPSEYATSDVLAWLTDADNPYARNGYCEQFATAMALLARAVGVPSRVVLGFTPGEVLNDTRVLVTDRNAHAWVELWIPAYGWMAFDPTPRSRFAAPTANQSLEAALGFSPVDYLDEIPTPSFVDAEGGQIGPEGRFGGIEDREGVFVPSGGGTDGSSTVFRLPSWAPFALTAMALLVAAALASPIVKWFRRRRLARRLASGDVTAAWEDIVDRLTDLGEPVDPAHTPLEAARAIDSAFVPLADEYGKALYGEGPQTTAVIEKVTSARERAEQHLTTRYSRQERLVATYRPSRLIARWKAATRRRGSGM